MILVRFNYTTILFVQPYLVGARIIKAENVRVKAGEKAELSCTVDGMPKPKVIWTVALKDTNPSLGLRGNNNKVKAVSPVTKKVYVTARNQRRYTCIAKNTIVKNGLKTTVIQSATILLTIESELQCSCKIYRYYINLLHIYRLIQLQSILPSH